ALLGHRIAYQSQPPQIQIDGGRINRWTGATQNINIGKNAATTPHPEQSDLDFVSGASMVASRNFVEQAGLMPEQYFLYYEEVDWAQRRGALPLVICKDAVVYHSAGASIGSPTLSRGPSPISAYFKHRGRLMFMAQHHPLRVPIAYLFGWGKIIQHALRRQFTPIPAIVWALHGRPAGRKIRSALDP
ncbi:glycosyltransferase family 2 protein, partial [Litoreibacter halocynthiae]|uniref:glycosyltransferase family 2 protein n=1 Tax=Litoreibacter halocynthiae TaxID=1242689 RepID=UPI003D7EE69B